MSALAEIPERDLGELAHLHRLLCEAFRPGGELADWEAFLRRVDKPLGADRHTATRHLRAVVFELELDDEGGC